MKATAVAWVACFLAGCSITPTRSQTCDRATVVVVFCTLARCDVPSDGGAKPPNAQAKCESQTDGGINDGKQNEGDI